MENNLYAEFKAYHEEKERERKEAAENVVYGDEYLAELARQHRERKDYIDFLLLKGCEQAEEERMEKAQAEIAAAKAKAESEITEKYREENPAQWNESETDAAYRSLLGQLFSGSGKDPFSA